MPKKLIEVALPLDEINNAAAREKSIRHGHPSTLHLWWARRPLAAARAVIWSSLVDDPSEHPEFFPTEEAQNRERERLFQILKDLVVWENSTNETVLDVAKKEILKYTNGDPPALLDPFAGGGSIPLEAQRLGLEAHAHDLNPVAVMINKAMIEIPPHFAGRPPINPVAQSNKFNLCSWQGASGLAADVEYYGRKLKDEVFKRIGHLYPKLKVHHGNEEKDSEATVIAWIWTRTVKCPNPACECEVPLIRSFNLSKKRGHEAYIKLSYEAKNVSFEIHSGKNPSKMEGTISRKGGICPCCGSPLSFPYIRECGQHGQISSKLAAIVVESDHGRKYYAADDEQLNCAEVDRPENYPDAQLPNNPQYVMPPFYGLNNFGDLFTNRQMKMLTTFCELLAEITDEVHSDAIKAGVVNDTVKLVDGGSGATAYSEAIAVYLSFVIDKLTAQHSSICSWDTSRDTVRSTFGRQAIAMVWDFAECNPFCSSSGCFANMLDWVTKAVSNLPANSDGYAQQFDAQSDCRMRNIMVSTDPPYYDNIVYSDLSDFFYIWLEKSLSKIYPSLFETLLVPKSEELVVNRYRFDGKAEEAKKFFENGMSLACRQMFSYSRSDIPVTIYYAYKQSETNAEDQTSSSSGWETMLSAIIRAGFAITGTWPLRTEMIARLRANDSNALASSIVLVCRKRNDNAPPCTRRDFVNALKRELKSAINKLQQSNIAPVDLAQSAIGPGIGVFSRYKKVLESDGTEMTVRSALQIINQELDMYFSGQDSNIDNESRLCVELFAQYGYNTVKFGDADILARAKGTSVKTLAGQGILYAAKGDVRLLTRDELPKRGIDINQNNWTLTQYLTNAMETGGIDACAEIIAHAVDSRSEAAKNLAYRLYSICERKNWAQEAYAYNALVVAWSEIQSKANEINVAQPIQTELFDLEGK